MQSFLCGLLWLSGYRSRHLVLGRLTALWTVGVLLSLPYFLLIRLDQHDVRYRAIALIMLLTVAVAAPFGPALAAVLPRELEGTLVEHQAAATWPPPVRANLPIAVTLPAESRRWAERWPLGRSAPRCMMG